MNAAARPMATASPSRPGARFWPRPESSPDVLVFEIDTDKIELARRRIPALHHGRAFGLKPRVSLLANLS